MEPLRFAESKLYLLDQRLLPARVEYVECDNWRCVAECISQMVVRGAPAIGAAAAFGMALAALEHGHEDLLGFTAALEEAARGLKGTRPTAVNLAWAVDRMLATAARPAGRLPRETANELTAEAERLASEDIETNRRIGRFGAELVPDGTRILTHCNAGALATAGYGTALGVVRSAAAAGKQIHVFAGETRPYLQGARLTAWELVREHIPVTLLADNMAGFLMQQGKVDQVWVGADRIAASGDVANKIGTYSLAVLAAAHRLPFYVAAPFSTFDLTLHSGAQIPIEERCETELTHFAGVRVAPEGVACYNPSFDVTPAALVTAIVTEFGVIHNPDAEKIRVFFGERDHAG
jgi:methylthioribose-1-phosphate isomerase